MVGVYAGPKVAFLNIFLLVNHVDFSGVSAKDEIPY
jgi:hypothetical protein